MPYANHDIVKGKGLYKIVKGLLIRKNDTRFNLGNHNVLLEANYDLWAWKMFGPIANIERACLDRTRIKVRVGLLKLYLPGF